MARENTMEGIAFALVAEFEKFAGLAFGNIQMGPRGQPPGYCGHNLASLRRPWARKCRAGVRSRFSDQATGGLRPISADGKLPASNSRVRYPNDLCSDAYS